MARRRPVTTNPPPRSLLLVLLTAIVISVACGADGVAPSATPAPPGLPQPTCGGLKIAIDPSLPCDQVAAIALKALGERAAQQLARGVSAIDVVLADCPRGEVPPQITCGNSRFAQLVTVTFGPAGDSGLIEPSLTVAVEPTTGAILGIVNPLIR
jgi:hypothetical protein